MAIITWAGMVALVVCILQCVCVVLAADMFCCFTSDMVLLDIYEMNVLF